jgi:3,4-dihydroxy 2-butanone 4-phosphate synthase/GTP cyclohydrolase II
MTFGTVEQAIRDIGAGKFVLVADDEDRENEGDLICAASLVTPEMVNFMIKRAGGLICLALTGDRVDQLGLAPMAE